MCLPKQPMWDKICRKEAHMELIKGDLEANVDLEIGDGIEEKPN